jgi:hypothetical protein
LLLLQLTESSLFHNTTPSLFSQSHSLQYFVKHIPSIITGHIAITSHTRRITEPAFLSLEHHPIQSTHFCDICPWRVFAQHHEKQAGLKIKPQYDN